MEIQLKVSYISPPNMKSECTQLNKGYFVIFQGVVFVSIYLKVFSMITMSFSA